MIEQALTSMVTWVSDVFDQIVTFFLGQISFNKTMVSIYLPGLQIYSGFILILGTLAVFACLIIAAMQMMAIPITGQERQSMVVILVRAFVAGGLVYASSALTGPFQDIIDSLYQWISQDIVPNFSLTGIQSGQTDAGYWDRLKAGSAMIGGGVAITILGIIILVALIKAIIATFTRVILLIISFYVAPLCLGFFANPSTSVISASWLKSVAGQSVLVLLSVYCLKVVTASLADNAMIMGASTAYAGTTETEGAAGVGLETVATGLYMGKMMYCWFLCKVVVKLEDFVKSIGFNPYPTGASIRTGLGSVIAMAMMATRTFRLGKTGVPQGSRMGNPASGNGAKAMSIQKSPQTGTKGNTGHIPGPASVKGSSDTTGVMSGKAVREGTGHTAGFDTSGTSRKGKNQFRDARTKGTPIQSPDVARMAANDAWGNGKSINGSVLNTAFQGTGNFGKDHKFIDHENYAMDKDGHVAGPMAVRKGSDWEQKDMVTAFRDHGKLNGKEFIREDGAIMKADTSRYKEVSSDGSIRSYPLKSTGETVSARSARAEIRSQMKADGSFQAETFNTANIGTGQSGKSASVQAVQGSVLKANTREQVVDHRDGKDIREKVYDGSFRGRFQTTNAFTGETKEHEGVYFPEGYKKVTVNQDGTHFQDSDTRLYKLENGSDGKISRVYTMPDGKGQVGILEEDTAAPHPGKTAQSGGETAGGIKPPKNDRKSGIERKEKQTKTPAADKRGQKNITGEASKNRSNNQKQ